MLQRWRRARQKYSLRAHWLREADGLVRLHALGFLVIWPLLGAAAAASWTPRLVLGITAVTLFFNTFGAILNDVVDLELDRTNPLRTRGPLVRGAITRLHAVILTLLQLPLIVIAHWTAGFPFRTLGWVAAGLVGMAAYDLWSKKATVPPLIEASQAAAGSLLVLYGASVAGQPFTAELWPVALSAAIFILFVNAFHGGLRDVENDRSRGQRTTPIWLGCRGVVNGKVHIAPAMSVYSASLQGAMVACAVWASIELQNDQVGLALVVLASAVNIVVFVGEHAVRKPAWDVLLRVHVASAAVPLMLTFVPRLGAIGSAVLFSMYFAPMLAMDRSHLVGSAGPTPVENRRMQMSPSR